jgi:hypothetical protein
VGPDDVSKNRDRLLEGDIAQAFFTAVVGQIRKKKLLSDEHFSIHGTLLEAWASHKSFRRKDGSGALLQTTIRATRRSTFMANGARTRRTDRPRTPTPCWPRKQRAKKRS